MQRRGARPEALLFGGTFWLVGVPAVAFPFAYAAWPFFARLGGCAAGCSWLAERSRWSLVATIAIAGTFLALTALFAFARRRPSAGYPLFAAIGVVILGASLGIVVIERQPLLLPVVLSWPGWSGIAFITAARRARQPAGPTPVWRPW
ncbi:MAG TPA: hypothetical protein VFV72_00095 [Candidatus Limnocylindrales bacterium]|nr:hypothetical protein [Candidatus Limnocylindrales bacterium]